MKRLKPFKVYAMRRVEQRTITQSCGIMWNWKCSNRTHKPSLFLSSFRKVERVSQLCPQFGNKVSFIFYAVKTHKTLTVCEVCYAIVWITPRLFLPLAMLWYLTGNHSTSRSEWVGRESMGNWESAGIKRTPRDHAELRDGREIQKRRDNVKPRERREKGAER